MLTIKVLGPGCANCQKVEALAWKAAANMGVEAEITKITDYAEIHEYTPTTPGLVINEKLVCSGRVPTETEVMTWVANALQTA